MCVTLHVIITRCDVFFNNQISKNIMSWNKHLEHDGLCDHQNFNNVYSINKPNWHYLWLEMKATLFKMCIKHVNQCTIFTNKIVMYTIIYIMIIVYYKYSFIFQLLVGERIIDMVKITFKKKSPKTILGDILWYSIST